MLLLVFYHNSGTHMEKRLEDLTESDFQSQFEDQSLPSEYFNHIGHLRIAWIYLSQNSIELALSKTSSGIKLYATSLGAPDKFHVKITDAIIRIISKRREIMKVKDWSLFLSDNADLVEDAIGLLSQFYTKELLFSFTAQTQLIEPDKRAI